MDVGFNQIGTVGLDIQPVAFLRVDPLKRSGQAATRMRTIIEVDCGFAMGDSYVIPAYGEQWYVVRIDQRWRLWGRIPYNDSTLLIEPKEGQVNVGSAKGPLELNGSVVNVYAPLTLSPVSNGDRPPADSVEPGTIIYDRELGLIFSDGNEWQTSGGGGEYEPGTVPIDALDIGGTQDPGEVIIIDEDGNPVWGTVTHVESADHSTTSDHATTADTADYASTAGASETASRLEPGAKINGTLFDGSSDITIGMADVLPPGGDPGDYLDGDGTWHVLDIDAVAGLAEALTGGLFLPLTTKGDILTRTSTELVRKAVGADDTILMAAASEIDGLKWGSLTGGQIPGLDCSKIISGIFAPAQCPTLDQLLGLLTPGQVPSLDDLFGTLTPIQCPTLDQLLGTLTGIQIPGLDASKIISGVFGDSFVPDLPALRNAIGQALTGGTGGAIYDDLARPDSTDLGSNWVERLGNAALLGGRMVPTTSGWSTSTWATPVAENDMTVSIIAGPKFGSYDKTIVILGAGDDGKFSGAYWNDDGTVNILTATDFSFGGLAFRATVPATWAEGDMLSIRRVGNVYTALKNGIAVSGATWTDATNAHPRDASHRFPGIAQFGSPDNCRTVEEFSAQGITPTGFTAADIKAALESIPGANIATTLLASVIPGLDASKIISGIFTPVQCPTLDELLGMLDSGQIPSLDASKITSGEFLTALIPNITLPMSTDMQAMVNNAWAAMFGSASGEDFTAGRAYSDLSLDVYGSGGYSLGNRFQFNKTGRITSLWFYRVSSSNVTSRTLRIHNLGGTLLLTSPPTTEYAGLAGWIEVPLLSPFDVTAGQQFVIAYDSLNSDFAYSNTQKNSSYPNITYLTGQYQGGAGVYPGTSAGSNYMVDATLSPLSFINRNVNDFKTALLNIPGANVVSLLLSSVIPGLDASKVISGIFGTGQIPGLDCSKLVSGALDLLRIPALPADQITSGVFGAGFIPSLDASKITGGTFLESLIPALSLAKIPFLPADQITSGTLAEALIPLLTAAKVPSLDASKIITGIFGSGLIPSLDASKITSGLFPQSMLDITTVAAGIVTGILGAAQIPSLDASKITSGIFPSTTIPNISPTKIVPIASSFGAAEYFLASKTLTDSVSGSYRLGSIWRFKVTGRVIGARFYRHSGSTMSNRQMQIWKGNTGAPTLTQTAINDTGTNSGWTDCMLATPISVAVDDEFTILYPNTGGMWQNNAAGSQLPPDNPTHISWLASCYSTDVGGTGYPTNIENSPGYHRATDLIFEPSVGGAGEILLTSIIPGLDASKITTGEFLTALIPALSASKITSGTFADSFIPGLSNVWGAGQIPGLDVSKIISGIFPAARVPELDDLLGTLTGGQIPALDASKITSGQFPQSMVDLVSVAAGIITGTIALAQIPGLPAGQITSGTFGAGLIPSLDASKITSGLFSAGMIPPLDASWITTGAFLADRIPGLDATKIESGFLNLLRIPGLPANQITSGTFGSGLIPSLDASKITSGLFAAGMIPPLDASWITTGAFNPLRIPGLDASKIEGGTFLETLIPTLTAGKIPSLDASKITAGTFLETLIPALTIGKIPDLTAAKITSGTFLETLIPALTVAKIPSLPAGQITSGTFLETLIPTLTAGKIPNLDATKITSGTMAQDRIAGLLGVVAALSGVRAGGTNLASDPNGSRADLWTGNGSNCTTAVSTDTSLSGTQSVKVVNSTGTLHWVYTQRTSAGGQANAVTLDGLVFAKPGDIFSAETWVRVNASVSAVKRTRLEIGLFDSTGTNAFVATAGAWVTPTSTGWTMMTHEYTIPAGYDMVSARIVWEFAATNGDAYYLDNMVLKEVTPQRDLGAAITSALGGTGSLPAAVNTALQNIPGSKIVSAILPAIVPNLDASKLTTGTFLETLIPALTLAKIPSLPAGQITTGTFLETLIPTLTSGKIPDLDGSKITSGSVAAARIANLAIAQITSLPGYLTNLNASGIFALAGLAAGAFPVGNTLAGGQLTGNGTIGGALLAADISATKITSGTFLETLIPALTVAKIPSLPASQITSGSFARSLIGITDFENLVAGSDFEGTHPWTLGGGFAVATDQFYTGTKSLKSSGNNAGSCVPAGTFAARYNDQFYVEYYARRDAAFNADQNARIRLGDQAGTFLGQVSHGLTDLPAADTWYKRSGVVTVTIATTTALNVQLVTPSTHTAGNIWIDDIVIRRVKPAETVGNLPGEKITSGFLALARLASGAFPAGNTLAGGQLTGTNSIAATLLASGIDATKVTTGTFLETLIPALTVAKIPDLAGEKITSGSVADARVPGLASRLLTTIFDTARKAGSNTVVSPDFADNTVLRYCDSGAYSTEQFHTGSQSFRMQGRGAGGGENDLVMAPVSTNVAPWTASDTAFRVVPGERYYVEAWVFGKSTNVGSAHYVGLYAGFFNSTGSPAPTYSALDAPNTWLANNTAGGFGWTKLYGSVSIPAGYDRFSPYVYLLNGFPTTDYVYVDSIMVRDDIPRARSRDLQTNFDEITNGLLGGTGYQGQGVNKTTGEARGAIDSIYADVLNANKWINALKAQEDAAQNSGVATVFNFAEYADGNLPSIFTVTYSGSGTSTLGVTGGKGCWRNKVNDGNRDAIAMYNVGPSGSDYQLLRGTLGSLPEKGGTGGTPRIGVVGRANSGSNPTAYVWAEGYCTGFLTFKGDMGYVMGGSRTNWVTNVGLTWSMDITCYFGVGNQKRRYQFYSGTSLIYDHTEVGTASGLGAGYRYYGMLASIRTDSGGTPTVAGSLAGASVRDNEPPLVLGSSAEYVRTLTGNMSFPNGDNLLVQNFWEKTNRCSPDITYNLTTGAFQVSKAGSYHCSARIKTTSISPSAGEMLLYKNGTLAQRGQRNFYGQATTYIWGSWDVYLEVNDYVQLGATHNGLTGNYLTGEATGTESYFNIQLTNRSYS